MWEDSPLLSGIPVAAVNEVVLSLFVHHLSAITASIIGVIAILVDFRRFQHTAPSNQPSLPISMLNCLNVEGDTDRHVPTLRA